MALSEKDKEDLMKQATQYERRLRFQAKSGKTVFSGITKKGGLSLFDDQERVLHFNAELQLRRLFWEGQRYSAANGKLEQVGRHSKGGRVQLVRETLKHGREQDLLQMCLTQVRFVYSELSDNSVEVELFPVGDSSLIQEVLSMLKQTLDRIVIAQSASA